MVVTETERDYDKDGCGIIAAKNFGALLAWCGSDQLLPMAYAVITQAEALRDFSNFTQQEHDFLAMARNVVKAYTIKGQG